MDTTEYAKKQIYDLIVTYREEVGAQCVLLRCKPMEGQSLQCLPGQFAQLRIDAPDVFLRRPISIHDVNDGKVSFLVQLVGAGTQWLGQLSVGEKLNAVMPLGHGFNIDENQRNLSNVLLVGGGVGVAPLLFLGKTLKDRGLKPKFLLGARTRDLLLRLDAFQAVGDVYVTTEDGSMGERGYVTQHSLLTITDRPTCIFTCGPTPMMRAVAQWALKHNVYCEVSLENRMACGVGACLCCVTNTPKGHRCVCTEGPVFRADDLEW